LPNGDALSKIPWVAKPQPTVWEIEEHTKAKHRILRRYLEAWLPIMSQRNHRLVYVDGFAGPGVYAGGEPGSPIIALQAFLQHAYRARITAELIYVFIEEDPRRFARLGEEVGKLGALPDQLKIDMRQGAYEDVFGAVLEEIERRGARLAPTFAFVDPFGYSDASMKLSGRFLQFDRCEVLIYFPLSYLNRFVGRAGQAAAFTTLYGTDEWRRAIDLQGAERQRFLLDLFQQQLVAQCGLTDVRSFEIVTATPNAGYDLVFGTRHELGLERMKEAMWTMDPVAGVRFVDSTSAQGTLFEPEPDTRALAQAFRERFGTAPFSIEDAERFTRTTAYLKSHVRRRTLQPLEDAGRLAIVSTTAGRRRGTYPAGTTMRFLP